MWVRLEAAGSLLSMPLIALVTGTNFCGIVLIHSQKAALKVDGLMGQYVSETSVRRRLDQVFYDSLWPVVVWLVGKLEGKRERERESDSSALGCLLHKVLRNLIFQVYTTDWNNIIHNG